MVRTYNDLPHGQRLGCGGAHHVAETGVYEHLVPATSSIPGASGLRQRFFGVLGVFGALGFFFGVFGVFGVFFRVFTGFGQLRAVLARRPSFLGFLKGFLERRQRIEQEMGIGEAGRRGGGGDCRSWMVK